MRTRAEVESLASASNASVSVWMGSLDGHAWFELDADRTHPAASTLKLALLVAAHRAVERGQIALDDDIAVHETFASAGEGETYDTTEEYDNDPQPWELIGQPPKNSRVRTRAEGKAALSWLSAGFSLPCAAAFAEAPPARGRGA